MLLSLIISITQCLRIKIVVCKCIKKNNYSTQSFRLLKKKNFHCPFYSFKNILKNYSLNKPSKCNKHDITCTLIKANTNCRSL